MRKSDIKQKSFFLFFFNKRKPVPGPVRTKLGTGLWKGDAEARIVRGQPRKEGDNMGYYPHTGIWLGRIGEPDDFGGVVAFLISEDSRLMTGQTLTVDGGAYTRL